MIIPSHKFDKRIKIKRIASSENVGGQKKSTYTTLAELWSRLEYREETRKVTGRVEQVVQRPIFTVRRFDGIRKTDLLEFEEKEYRIDSAIPTDNNEYTIIRAYIDDTN